MQAVEPVTLKQRHFSLDLIRGVAILCILVMNIQSFGNLFASYSNPLVNGDFSGINKITWIITHVFFEQKFYTIFSMLFGAGIVMMAERANAKGVTSKKYHYRRNILLIIFGLLHGFFIWYGDILNVYGLFGLIIYFAWNKSSLSLIISGTLLILIISLFMFLGYFFMTPEDINHIQKGFYPKQSIVNQEITAYQAGFSENFSQRFYTMLEMLSFTVFYGLRTAGGMLIGMGLYKIGVFTASRDIEFYKKLIILFFFPGLVVVSIGCHLLLQHNFVDARETQLMLSQYNYFGSLLMSIGYVGMLNWLFLSSNFKKVILKLQAVGQMAFTNYIAQSLICTFIFYGFGLGLFAQLSRFELILVALSVMALQIFYSSWWLSHFNFGPLEWLWRSLTYLKLQPFKKHNKW